MCCCAAAPVGCRISGTAGPCRLFSTRPTGSTAMRLERTQSDQGYGYRLTKGATTSACPCRYNPTRGGRGEPGKDRHSRITNEAVDSSHQCRAARSVVIKPPTYDRSRLMRALIIHRVVPHRHRRRRAGAGRLRPSSNGRWSVRKALHPARVFPSPLARSPAPVRSRLPAASKGCVAADAHHQRGLLPITCACLPRNAPASTASPSPAAGRLFQNGAK